MPLTCQRCGLIQLEEDSLRQLVFYSCKSTDLRIRLKRKPALGGQASSRSGFLRERWGIIREVGLCSRSGIPSLNWLQIILRNENFTPPALGGHDRSNYLKLTSTRNLLGRAGQLFLLFGMLSRDPEGRLCLEDGEGRVRLDMEDAVSCVVLDRCQLTCSRFQGKDCSPKAVWF
jgi:hypothetical protein